MNFEEMRLSCKEFTDDVSGKLMNKMPAALKKAEGLPFIPYTVRENEWAPGPFDGICWWTNGFWPGQMWAMYRMTGDDRYRQDFVTLIICITTWGSCGCFPLA